MVIAILIVILILTLVFFFGDDIHNPKKNATDEDALSDAWLRLVKGRRGYYNDVYLKSEAWQRKRYVVLKRDKWCCVYCGKPATQVHHTRYAKYNIGKEPIKWLVSVCNSCHDKQHKFK